MEIPLKQINGVASLRCFTFYPPVDCYVIVCLQYPL